MAKFYFLIILLLVNYSFSQAQIPNGSFELWEDVFDYEKPISWWTNQDTLYSRFEKDSNSIEGDFSLKIIPGAISSWNGCESRASIHVDFGNPLAKNSALTFFIKAISIDSSINNDPFLRIYIYYIDSLKQTNTILWSVPETFNEFTRIQIPLPDENLNGISILIAGGAGTNPTDGPCIHRTISWIDEMTIESISSNGYLKFQQNPEISVYPNPSSGLINVTCVDKAIMEYQLYSLTGEIISKGKMPSGQLLIQNKGIYILKLLIDSGTNGTFYSELIVVY